MAGDSAYRRRGGGEGYADKYSGKASGASGRDWAPQYRGQPPSADKNVSLEVGVQGVEDAEEPTEWALKCASVVLENSCTGRVESEKVLAKINTWLAPSMNRQALPQIGSSALPGAIVRTIMKFREEPLTAALCCTVLVRSAGSTSGAQAYIRANALEEIGALMDRHPQHGGVQNVCLLALCGLMKDGGAARQAVTQNMVSRVLRSMESSAGREVQFNGLNALRLLVENGRAQRTGLQEAALRAKVEHQNDDCVATAADEVLGIVTSRFKEVLCWHWQSGWCKLGPRCTYAHGPADLHGH